ncbi:MAG: hypothetical protein AAF685_10520 [Cyanobacteria bacterium P01_C01_bin.89]
MLPCLVELLAKLIVANINIKPIPELNIVLTSCSKLFGQISLTTEL